MTIHGIYVEGSRLFADRRKSNAAREVRMLPEVSFWPSCIIQIQ